jgi:P27 family predicted phage terminase small subunit
MAVTTPSHLSKPEKFEFKRLTQRLGIEFQASDRDTLIVLASAIVVHRLASEDIAKNGITITETRFSRAGAPVGTVTVRNPSLMTLRESSATIMRASSLLGISDVLDADEAE